MRSKCINVLYYSCNYFCEICGIFLYKCIIFSGLDVGFLAAGGFITARTVPEYILRSVIQNKICLLHEHDYNLCNNLNNN